jgi:TolB protein
MHGGRRGGASCPSGPKVHPMTRRDVRARVLTAALAACLLAIAASERRVEGQSAVSHSRPGQEDLSFWVNHNGLLQYEVEGETGFGDMARILLRRRSNGPLLIDLRDRFTFRVQDPARLATPDLFHVVWNEGRLEWRAAPDASFVAAASRTFNLALVLENRSASEAVFEARYAGPSMASASGRVAVPPRSSASVFLRAVEPRPGPAQGRLTVKQGASELSTGVRFDVRPLVPLRVRLLDELGRPAVARVYLTGSDGLAYAPPGSSDRITAMSAEHFFHAEDSFELELPAGDTLVEAARGLEYRLASSRVTLVPGRPAETTLRLARWTDRKRQGFWSSDVHIHANYTAPHHQSIEPRDVRLQVWGEDLNYANMMVANSSGAFLHDRQYFEGRPHRMSAPPYFVYWNEENRSGAYGHMCFLGLKKLVEPFYNGFRDTEWWDDFPANYPLAQQVYDQGGAVSYAHPGMVAQFEGASIKELPVDLALGHQTAMDVLSNSDETPTTEMWSRLLNCGFRVPISAGTDSFTNVADHYLAGGGRVYVQAGPRFDYAAWLEAYRRGRSFASNGPMVWLTVNGAGPGEEVRLDGPATVAVLARVSSQVPLDRVELIVNGRPVHEENMRGGETLEFRKQLPLRQSSWLALRATGPRHRLVLNDTGAFAHTSAVYVPIGGRPVRVAEDVRFYREWVEKLIARVESRGRFAAPERKAEVLALFRKALAWYHAAEKE